MTSAALLIAAQTRTLRKSLRAAHSAPSG